MNIAGAGAPGATGAARTAPAERKSERREPSADLAQPQAQFELALRAKQSHREGKDDREDDRQDEPSDAAKSGLAAGFAAHQPAPLRAAEQPAPSAPPAAEGPSTGPRAAIEAALNAHVAPSITEVGAGDPAALWEASVCEPNSVGVEVRALRAERSGLEANAAWTLSVRSSNVSAETLARHAPRLDERLRKRGVDAVHVRIEDDAREPDQE